MPLINLENNDFLNVEKFQTKKKIKIYWDKLPKGGKILVHYKNGIYIGVERDALGKINIVYTSRIASAENGETIFGAVSQNKERSLIRYESKI